MTDSYVGRVFESKLVTKPILISWLLLVTKYRGNDNYEVRACLYYAGNQSRFDETTLVSKEALDKSYVEVSMEVWLEAMIIGEYVPNEE